MPPTLFQMRDAAAICSAYSKLEEQIKEFQTRWPYLGSNVRNQYFETWKRNILASEGMFLRLVAEMLEDAVVERGTDDLSYEELALIRQTGFHSKIAAIKKIRETRMMGLAEAKHFVEDWRKKLGIVDGP